MVIGGAVQIAGGVSVGKIEDVVLNDSGCIGYAVVAYQDQYVAIPWNAVSVDFQQRIVSVDITQERFATVPRFRRDEFSSSTGLSSPRRFTTSSTGKAPQADSGRRESGVAQGGTDGGEERAEAWTGQDGGKANPQVESPAKPQGQPLGNPRGAANEGARGGGQRGGGIK